MNGLENALGLGGSAFRISRFPTNGSPLEVHYTLSAFGTQGATTSRDGAVTIPVGTGHTIIPIGLAKNGSASGHEVLTLALRDRPDYQIGTRSVALIRDDADNRCSDAALLHAYRQVRSPEAFTALFERYRNSVFHTSYSLLGTCQDAEDVMQIVFLALAQRPLKIPTTLTGWLARVTRNAAITLLRARRRRARRERTVAQPVGELSNLPGYELGEELEAALGQLPPAMREAVRLRYLEGQSQQDAARIAGCPRGTLSQRAARGIARLRAILGVPPSSLPET